MIRIGRARFTVPQLAALAAGLAVFGYLAWDQSLWDPRFQVPLHLIAAGAIASLALLAWRGAPVPRTRLELPILVLVVVLGVATLTSENVGLSARSLAASIAWALLLPVALLIVRRRPVVTAVAVSVPVIGLAAATLVPMIARRAAWFVASGPGLPPVRLAGESTPFGSVAVPPFILMACLGLLPLIDHRGAGRAVGGTLVVLGVPLTLLSGSRSAWLAIVVATLAFAAPLLQHARIRIALPRSPGAIGGSIVAIAAGILAVLFVAPRLTAITSLLYRENLWRDTLRAWAPHPILGIGPGIMPYARQAAAPPGTFPAIQPHSHDVALGLLGDAGVIGLLAGVGLVATFLWVAGPHRARSVRGRVSSSVLIGFLAAGLFEDLTFLPGFDLLVLLLVAISLEDSGAVSWIPFTGGRGGTRASDGKARLAFGLSVLAGAALCVPLVATDTAGIVYRVASDLAWAREWRSAEDLYQLAYRIDPWHPAGPKALAVAADYAGDGATALAAARSAVALNPGDDASWTNLAILCQQSGQTECARHAADQAVAYSGTAGDELFNAALVYEKLGDPADADAAYRRSQLVNMQTTLVARWPRPVGPGDELLPELGGANGELSLLVAHRTAGDPIVPERYATPSVRALAYALIGDERSAAASLARAQAENQDDTLTWDIAVLLQRHWGEDASRAETVGQALRGGPLASGPPEQARLIWDIASFRPYPGDGLVSSAERLLPREAWPQMLDVLLTPQG